MAFKDLDAQTEQWEITYIVLYLKIYKTNIVLYLKIYKIYKTTVILYCIVFKNL